MYINETDVIQQKLSGTYWLVILWLRWGGGSRCGHGDRSGCGGLRHHSGLDRGELMPGRSLSRGGQLRLSSMGL